jgi:hypothetical protein
MGSTKKGVTIIMVSIFVRTCAIYTRNFTCVSQTSGTIRHAFPRTSGQEGSFFFFRLSLFEFFCAIFYTKISCPSPNKSGSSLLYSLSKFTQL